VHVNVWQAITQALAWVGAATPLALLIGRWFRRNFCDLIDHRVASSETITSLDKTVTNLVTQVGSLAGEVTTLATEVAKLAERRTDTHEVQRGQQRRRNFPGQS
jgi:hypothetical protein